MHCLHADVSALNAAASLPGLCVDLGLYVVHSNQKHMVVFPG